MDGGVVHSMPVHNEAWGVYLARHGIHLDRAAIEVGMHGKHNAEAVAEFFGNNLTAAEIQRHGAEKEKVYRDLMRPRLQDHLVPGLAEFLARHAYTPMGVATNAERANVDFVLDGAGLRHYFAVILDGQQVARPKPDPEVYLRAAEALGVNPTDCVIFEDSDTGIQAARGAGARVVGLTTTSAEPHGTDLTISDFCDPKLDLWLEALPPI